MATLDLVPEGTCFEMLAALAPQILCWLSSALAGFEELIWIEGLFVFEHGVECME